jgi:hypothetical protein
MSPRGYHQRESIHPHFTTDEYIQSDQGKSDYATMDKIETCLASLYKYPAKIARRVWIWILFRLGHLKDLSK